MKNPAIHKIAQYTHIKELPRSISKCFGALYCRYANGGAYHAAISDKSMGVQGILLCFAANVVDALLHSLHVQYSVSEPLANQFLRNKLVILLK